MSSPPPHYFAAEPDGPMRRRQLEVQLAGRRVTVVTAPGVFCPDRLDLGTSVLLRHVPPPPQTGALLDLGCGWGPIALTQGMLAPAAQVWGVDVNRRALQLLTENAALLRLPNVTAVLPPDLPAGTTFSTIWSNPPVRIGKPALHELLLAWLPRLRPGGTAYLVIQRHLGSDSLQTWLSRALPDMEVTRAASSKGFRVLAVTRPAPSLDSPA